MPCRIIHVTCVLVVTGNTIKGSSQNVNDINTLSLRLLWNNWTEYYHSIIVTDHEILVSIYIFLHLLPASIIKPLKPCLYMQMHAWVQKHQTAKSGFKSAQNTLGWNPYQIFLSVPLCAEGLTAMLAVECRGSLCMWMLQATQTGAVWTLW